MKYFLTVSTIVHQGPCGNLAFDPYHFYNCNHLMTSTALLTTSPYFVLTLLQLYWSLDWPSRPDTLLLQSLCLVLRSAWGYSSPKYLHNPFSPFFQVPTQISPSWKNIRGVQNCKPLTLAIPFSWFHFLFGIHHHLTYYTLVIYCLLPFFPTGIWDSWPSGFVLLTSVYPAFRKLPST